jgi:16S rRNA (guanine966-N2)-methyltransferase
MRIIAGKYRGLQLVSFEADHIRPTSDRVKGSIFNKLQFEIEGAKVLDLFSGTGSLSFEALSRGADHVTSIESNKKSIQIINENLKKLKIKSGIDVYAQDVFAFLKSYQGEGFDLIFIDPPFTEKMGHSVMQAVAESRVFKKTSLIVIEATKHEKVEETYGSLRCTARRDFGDKYVCYFQEA